MQELRESDEYTSKEISEIRKELHGFVMAVSGFWMKPGSPDNRVLEEDGGLMVSPSYFFNIRKEEVPMQLRRAPPLGTWTSRLWSLCCDCKDTIWIHGGIQLYGASHDMPLGAFSLSP